MIRLRIGFRTIGIRWNFQILGNACKQIVKNWLTKFDVRPYK